MTSTSRRWWHFSLWQLFAFVTVICVYLAYQVSVVRARQHLLKEFRTSHPFGRVTTADQYAQYPSISGFKRGAPVASVPIVRYWLGDRAIQSVGYDDRTVPKHLAARMKRSFPEAEVRPEQILYPPCHPGCFPHGSLVETPAGPRKIEAIAVGDEVYIISNSGEKKSVPVMSIFRTTNRLWEVRTTQGVLVTTETQPLCISLREHVPAGKLETGNTILAWMDDQLQAVRVEHVLETERVAPVVNLVLGNREPFVANGYLARSKPPADQ